MKAITVKCHSIQVTQGRMEPKLCEVPTASMEGRDVFIGPGAQWKIKAKDLVAVQVSANEIRLETEKKLSFVLQKSDDATVAEERQWDIFVSKIKTLYEKFHSKQAQHFSKFIETTSKHNLGSGNFTKRASVGAARMAAAKPRRGVFGSSRNAIHKVSLQNMPWDDAGIMGDSKDDEPRRPTLISGGRKLKPPQKAESFSSDEDQEPQQLSENEDRHSETEKDDRLSDEEKVEELQHKRKRRRKLVSKFKGRPTGLSHDDDTDDENIFDSTFDLTTPAAQRVVSPGGTNATTTAPTVLQDVKSNSECSVDAVETNQPSISKFFPVRKPAAPDSFDPRNNATSTPAKTPPRRFASSAAAARLVKAASAATTAKKKPLHEDTSWLVTSPARAQISSAEKRRFELFGRTAISTSRKRLGLSKHRDAEEEDPIEEYTTSPRRGAIIRPMFAVLHKNAAAEKTTPIRNDLTKALANCDGSPNAQPTFRGLRNLGNTCYLNASLQMLYTCRDLMSALRRSKGGRLTRSICAVARELQKANMPAVSPRMVKMAMDEKTDKFAGYEQRDAHEFLSDLVDFVHDELEKESKNDEEIAGEASKETKTKEYFPTDDFCMTVQVCLKCCSCGYSRNKEEMYRHLSIDIVSDESASSEATAQIVSMASVEKSLDHFFQPEVREIKCEKCNDGTHAQQTLRILSRPKVLLLHLKRFIAVERPVSPALAEGSDENRSPNSPSKPVQIEYIFKKNKAPVAIPPTLSLGRFRVARVEESPSLSIDAVATTEEESKFLLQKDYSLQSIVHHIGSRASSGHYTADAVRQVEAEESQEKASPETSEPVWVTFDDGNTVRTTLKTITGRFKQETAYMLLYTLDDSRTADPYGP